MDKKILLVEDEKIMAKNIAFFLQKENYQVDVTYDGLSGLEYFKQNPYDLLLLDWTLPKMDGLELCRQVRKTSQVPVIMITAKDEIMDKVIGLEVGADDYIVKPFHQRELLARMHALFRRVQQNGHGNRVLQYDFLVLNKDAMTLQYDEEKMDLTTTEYKLLELLMRHPENVFSRDTLFEHVWGDSMMINDRTVDVNISRLRKKIEQLSGKRYFQAIRGAGYRLKSDHEN